MSDAGAASLVSFHGGRARPIITMPRNSKSPRASEVHWLSLQEKEDFLKSLDGESFNNHIRRLIGRPPMPRGGSRNRPATEAKITKEPKPVKI